MEKKNNNRNKYLGTGSAIGIGVGATIGNLLDNYPAGLALGLPIGISWAMFMNSLKPQKIKSDKKRQGRR